LNATFCDLAQAMAALGPDNIIGSHCLKKAVLLLVLISAIRLADHRVPREG